MIEGIGCGIVASFAFIGFLFIVYMFILYFSSFKSAGKYIVHITNEMSKREIFDLIYGIIIRKSLCGDQIFSEVVLINSLTDDEKNKFLKDTCSDFNYFITINFDEIQVLFNNKDV